MAEIEVPIVNCIERIYELIHDGKKLRIKSTNLISSKDEDDIFLKEKGELLNFIEKYQVLEMSNISTSKVEYPKSTLIEKSSLIEDVTDKELIDFILPQEEDVINYITTKELFKHDTIELQEKFLGKRLQVRDDRKLFNSFDNILRRSRKYIANKHKIEWDTRERKSYGSRSHVILYKAKKVTDQQNSGLNSILQTELQPLVGNYKIEEQLNNIIA